MTHTASYVHRHSKAAKPVFVGWRHVNERHINGVQVPAHQQGNFRQAAAAKVQVSRPHRREQTRNRINMS